MRTPSEMDREFARLAAERAEKARIKPRKPSPAHEQARSTLETAIEAHRDRPNILGGTPDVPHVPTHDEMCDSFRRADEEREQNYEGYPVSEDKPRDLEEVDKAYGDAVPSDGTYRSPGSVDPSRFRRGLVIDGHHASASPGHDGPRSPVSPMEPVGPKFSTPEFNAASVSPPTAATGTDSHGRNARSVDVTGHVSGTNAITK